MFNRRKLLASILGLPLVSTLATAVSGTTARANDSDPITSVTPTDPRLMRINTELVARHPDLFEPAYFMHSPVQLINGVAVEAKYRVLSTTISFGDDDIRASVDTAVESIAREFREEMALPENRNRHLCPYELVRSSSIRIDPKSFEPVMHLYTRYGLVERVA